MKLKPHDLASAFLELLQVSSHNVFSQLHLLVLFKGRMWLSLPQPQLLKDNSQLFISHFISWLSSTVGLLVLDVFIDL